MAERRPLPIPFGDRWEGWIAWRRLQILAERLDELLDDPVSVSCCGDTRVVAAMGCVGYRIDYRLKTITPGRVHADGGLETMTFGVEVFRPLITSWWLRWLIDDLELSDDGPQGQLFIPGQLIKWQVRWLTNIAYDLLQRHPAFRRLRRYDLPHALKLDPTLVRIAMKIWHGAGWLSADEYALVWQKEHALRRLEKENAQLVPVVAPIVLYGEAGTGDPVADLKQRCRGAGISAAAWRYLTRHGWRIFKVPWELSPGRSRLDFAIGYLRALDRAGLPPPPPPSLLKPWSNLYIDATYDRQRENRSWFDLAGCVLRPALLEADRLRHSPDLPRFIQNFLLVVNWALQTEPRPDSNQRRAGWHWLLRQAREWEAELRLDSVEDNQRWPTYIDPFEDGGLIIQPLQSAAELTLEARRMRNCLAEYTDACADGFVRIFSVRTDPAARPLADIGVEREDDTGRWIVTECKGFANQPAEPCIGAIGAALVQRLSERTA
jgi:hypothetical protein